MKSTVSWEIEDWQGRYECSRTCAEMYNQPPQFLQTSQVNTVYVERCTLSSLRMRRLFRRRLLAVSFRLHHQQQGKTVIASMEKLTCTHSHS